MKRSAVAGWLLVVAIVAGQPIGYTDVNAAGSDRGASGQAQACEAHAKNNGKSYAKGLDCPRDVDPPRSSIDRPDDKSGYQVHALYVIPSDGEDRGFDTSGAITRSIEAFNSWLADQTGGRRLRIDTFTGTVDVTFYRLPRTDMQYASTGAYVRDEVQSDLVAAGFNEPNKIYAVYYDGGSTWSCGGGAWPPLLIGHVAAMYLRGTPANAPACDTNTLGASVESPGYFEWGMLHEIMHTLGFVATCAPHHHLAGHVSDDNRDLMWAGNAPWQFPPILDVGRNDYFEHAIPGCPDLARSVFLDPLPPSPVAPPGW